MPKFSRKSEDKLFTCAAPLQLVFLEVIREYDCTVLCGHRSKKKQDEAFRTGHSKLCFPNSCHNSKPSMAIDVAPYPIDWNDTKRFYHFGGYVLGCAAALGWRLRWGGDWDSDFDLNDQSFMDLVHFEFIERIEA